MIHREDAEQAALFQWANLTAMPPKLAAFPGDKIGDYLFSIPNGGFRNAREAARMKLQGVMPGVSDVFFSVPSERGHLRGYHGLYIEMKARKPDHAPVTDKQAQFQNRMFMVGYVTTVCYGSEEAERVIRRYLSDSKHPGECHDKTSTAKRG